MFTLAFGPSDPVVEYAWISASKHRFLVKPILPHTCSNTESWWLYILIRKWSFSIISWLLEISYSVLSYHGLVNENPDFQAYQFHIALAAVLRLMNYRFPSKNSPFQMFTLSFWAKLFRWLNYGWISTSKNQILVKPILPSHLQQHWVLVTYTFWFENGPFNNILAFGDKLFVVELYMD